MTMTYVERLHAPSNIDVMVVAAQRPWFVAAIRGAIAAMRDEWKRQRTIRELQELDDRMLADIGLTRGQVGYPPNDAWPAVGAHGFYGPVEDSKAWRRYWAMGSGCPR